MTGVSFTVPDSKINVFQIDGGQAVFSDPLASDSSDASKFNSVGILYPGERVDFVLAWSKPDMNTDTEIIIKLDKEYTLSLLLSNSYLTT